HTGPSVRPRFRRRWGGAAAGGFYDSRSGGRSSDMVTNTGMAGLEAVQRNWGWFLAGGIVFILLGLVALVYAFGVTVATVAVFGWLLIISGIVHLVQAFQGRGWSGFLLHLFGGLLEIVAGVIVAMAPVRGALAITVVLAA